MLCFKGTEFISHFVRQQSLCCSTFLPLWMCLDCSASSVVSWSQPSPLDFLPKEESALRSPSDMEKDDRVHREYRALQEHREFVSLSIHRLLTAFFVPYLSVMLQLTSCSVTCSSKCFSCCFSYSFLSLFGSVVPSPTLYPTKIVLSLFL